MRAEPGWYRAAAGGILALLAAVALWNAWSFDVADGYDGEAHVAYAETIAHDWRIPGKEQQGYYSPPLFYVLAGVTARAGDAVGLEGGKLVQGANVLVLLATAALLLATARLLFPGRLALHLGALAFFALVPVTTRTAAMFHPEPLDMLVSAAALWIAARMLVRRAFPLRDAVALGVALGAAQLVRQFGLYALGAVVLVFALAALRRLAPPRQALAALAVALVAAAAVAGPWYAYQASRFSNPVFDQPAPSEPLWERRPRSFYVGTGLPEVFTDPVRPSFVNRLAPQAYSELWGDYFGIWSWDASKRAQPEADALNELRTQAVIGVAPTALALAGLVALVAAGRRRPAPLLYAVHALLGLLGLVYFAVSYPTADGDTIKATFMVAAAPAWALCFGAGLDAAARRLGRRRAVVVAATVAVAAVALLDLRTIVYG